MTSAAGLRYFGGPLSVTFTGGWAYFNSTLSSFLHSFEPSYHLTRTSPRHIFLQFVILKLSWQVHGRVMQLLLSVSADYRGNVVLLRGRPMKSGKRTGPFFNMGIKIKNQVLSCNMIRWFSPHPLKSCWLLDRWSLPLFWHLSDISAMRNFWPQLHF